MPQRKKQEERRKVPLPFASRRSGDDSAALEARLAA
jgi:hypothetical protein